ncbi:MAG: hypothetical protein ACOCXI_13925 [Chloroflexota bacterium]
MTGNANSNEPFATWLAQEMEKRGLTVRGLASKAGVAHSSVSRALDHHPERPIGVQVATKIGRALGIPQETILRRARILERRPEMTYDTQFLVNVYERLAAAGREEELIKYAEFLLVDLEKGRRQESPAENAE